MKKSRQQLLIIFGQKIFLFIGVIVIIALMYNYISPTGIPLITERRIIYIGEEQYTIPVFHSGNNDSGDHNEVISVKNVDYDKALALFHATTPLFLDARSPEEYQAGHIPGALNIPVNDLESYELDLMTLPPDQIFVCYCDDPACDLALRLTFWLEEQGFTNLYYYHAGWRDWTKKGGQISRGERP